MKYDDKTILQQIRMMEYPGKADIVDAVMDKVRRQASGKKPRTIMLRRYSIAAAACVAVALVVSTLIYQTKDYNDPQICDMFASAYGSHQYDIASFDDSDLAYFDYLDTY